MINALILMISSKVVRHHRQPTLVKNIVQVIHINVAPLTYESQCSLTWVQSPFVKVTDLFRGETQSLSNLFPLFSACNRKTYISVLISNSQAGPRYSKLTPTITERFDRCYYKKTSTGKNANATENNTLSSHVKITQLLWLHNKSRLLQRK